jgi:hypothetical protein
MLAYGGSNWGQRATGASIAFFSRSGSRSRPLRIVSLAASQTVEAHVSAILRKLQLSNRHELSRWAVERRLVN